MSRLEGHRWSLGIYLIDENNECVAGCIDIDKGPITDPPTWARIVADKKLPLTVFESRSGKTHLYLFTSEPIPAPLMRRALTKFITLLGLPLETEIFPKQDTVDWEGGALGSWINVPFYGDERWPLQPDGRRLQLTAVPPHWLSVKALKEFVGPEEKPSGEKRKHRQRAKNDEDTFNADDAERWLEYHTECIANAPGDLANETLRDAIWSLGHMHEFLDKEDVKETLREGWHRRGKEDKEIDEAFNRWDKAVTHAKKHPDDPPPRWPEPAIVRNAATIEPELVRWLGRGWAAIGQIGLWSGDSDVGKSTTLADFLARLSNGDYLPLSDERLPKTRSLIMLGEEGAANEFIPRLIRAGADRSMIEILDGYQKRDKSEGEIALDRPEGRRKLEEVLRRFPGDGLLVLDPYTAFFSDKFNMNDTVQWRSRVMKPTMKLAQQYGKAVIFIAHPRKNKIGERAQHSVAGAGGQVQASRLHRIFGNEFRLEEGEEGKKKVPTGNFLIAYGRAAHLPREEKCKTLVGRLVSKDVVIKGIPTALPGVEWIGIREDVTADDVASDNGGVGSDWDKGSSGWSRGRKRNEAREFILHVLKAGPMLSDEVTTRALEAKISKTTLNRTKTQMADAEELFMVKQPGIVNGPTWLSLEDEIQWEMVLNPPF